jgi:EmrB/QacA subfamily drug resistance transporter
MTPVTAVRSPPAYAPHRALILAACMMATFMAAIEATIVAIAMPAIATKLGDYSRLSWVFSAYMLAQAATIPIYGRLADMYGRRRMFYAGAGLFVMGSALCGLSRTLTQLVLFRAIQGLGAGGVQPIANTIVGDVFPPVERARVQGWLSGVFGIAALIGPSFGALIAAHGNWPWVFWLNVPIGLTAIAMIAALLPEERIARRRRDVDYVGSVSLMIAVGAIMLLLVEGRSLSPANLAAASAAAGIALVILFETERRVSEPMLPLELWRDPIIRTAGLGALATGGVAMAVMAFLPTYVQGVMGKGSDQSAIVLSVMAVVWVLASTMSGLVLPNTSYRRVATAGTLALCCGAALLLSLSQGSGTLWVGIGASLIGVGMGCCNTTFMVSVQTCVAWDRRGAATSSCMFQRFLGQALGAAMFGAALNAGLWQASAADPGALDRLMDPAWRAGARLADIARLTDAATLAMHNAYLLVAVLALIALSLALTLPRGLGPARQSVLVPAVADDV